MPLNAGVQKSRGGFAGDRRARFSPPAQRHSHTVRVFLTGSEALMKTMGMVAVAAFAAAMLVKPGTVFGFRPHIEVWQGPTALRNLGPLRGRVYAGFRSSTEVLATKHSRSLSPTADFPVQGCCSVEWHKPT
jgi:hypothetical protein